MQAMEAKALIEKIGRCLDEPKVMTKDITVMAALLHEIKENLEKMPSVLAAKGAEK